MWRDEPLPSGLWGGRFAGPPAAHAATLNRSLPVDHRLWPHDLMVSRAWVKALCQAGAISPEEEAALADGLDRVGERLADGAGLGAPDEDVHALIERLLHEEVGEPALRLNWGRSRNDQVATDLRLWCLEAVAMLDRELAALGSALVAQARRGVDLLLPGYTHQQRAQPVRWAYVLLAHAWPLQRDRERLADWARRASELPLGVGALAGSAVPVDRVFLKETLGFRALCANGLDATGDRDFAAELVFCAALIATHLSRLAGELIAYASSEYGFVRLDDAYCTGSSLLPQKRNPDVLELARGKAARLLGNLTGLLAVLKGLPAGYSKDLQDDKPFVFDAVDTLLLVLPAVRGAVTTLKPVPDRMRAALDPALWASDAADLLADRGVPFREAHRLVGLAIRAAEERGVALTQLSADRLTAIHPALAGVVGELGSWESSVERRGTEGGASRASVLEQIEELARAFGAGQPFSERETPVLAAPGR